MADNTGTDSDNTRRTLIVATAGHVDHGKTSLVRHITGTDTDTLAEEKTRGLTINLGYAYYHFSTEIDGETQNCTIGFVDVPGHIDFINNMLAGVGAVEFALLVIAADDGIMPQTREHLAILDLLGVARGAIALTKIDRCDTQRIETVTSEIQELLSQTVLSDSPVFAISNESGEGISDLVAYLHTALLTREPDPAQESDHGFRYLIDRSFTVKGVGTVVTGGVRAGKICLGDTVMHTGSRQTSKIRGIRLDIRDLDKVAAGQRAAINIAIEQQDIDRGDWLIDPGIYHPVNRLDVTLQLIDADFKPRSSAHYHLYLGASHHIVTIRSLGESDQRFFQIKSHEPIIAHHGDRFIIRDPASKHTLGGGKVLDIFVPRKKRSSSQRLATLTAMNRSPDDALVALLEQLAEGISLDEFLLNYNLCEQKCQAIIADMKAQRHPFLILKLEKREHPVLLHDKFFSQYVDEIIRCLGDYHHSHQHQQGLSEPALSRAVDFEGSHLLFHAILHELIDTGKIKLTGTSLHLPQHETVLSREELEFLAKIRPLLLQAGNVPPRTRELVDLTGIPLKALQRILRETTKSGNLIQVADNRHYLPETIMALAEFTEQLARSSEPGEGFSVIQFRDASGIGRNLCIEILEYFDRVGFTRRDGNTRFLRTEKENIFGA